MKLGKLLSILVTLLVVGYVGWKIVDLRLSARGEVENAANRFPYADTFKHVQTRAYPNILRHARQIAAFGSRQTGQPGCRRAFHYVRSQVQNILGPDFVGTGRVTSGGTKVTVPVERYCRVVVQTPDGEVEYPAHALKPNSVQTSNTPPDGLTGKLTYLGYGTLDERQGIPFEDTIVVLEFNSGETWIDVIGRGAAAVIFLEPEGTTFREADLKYIDLLPVRATRVYLEGEAADAIRKLARDSKTTARIHSRQTIEHVDAPYIEVEFPGTDKAARTIILTCHLDATSIVPALTPGGDELWGVATWLELVRWFHERPPKNTIRMIAFTGHWQDFAASRDYLGEVRVVKDEKGNETEVRPHLDEIGTRVPVVMGLDLSTEEDRLTMLPDGWPQRGVAGWKWLVKLVWPSPTEPRQTWLEDIEKETGRRFRLYGDSVPEHPWIEMYFSPERVHTPAVLTGRFFVSSEAWQTANGRSFAWQTALLHRHHHFTPLDDFKESYARRRNLMPQLEVLFALLDNIVELPPDYFPEFAVRYVGLADNGYLEFSGRIVRYDQKTAWYKPGLPPDENGEPMRNTYVYMYPYDSRNRMFANTVFMATPLAPSKGKHRQMQSRMLRYMTKVDDEGRFRFRSVYYNTRFTRYTFLAFALDDDGRILHATDLGRYGADEFKYLSRTAEHWHIDQNVTVFPCGSVTLFDLLDRKRYSIGTNVQNTWYTQWGVGNAQQQDMGIEPYMPISEVKLYPSQTDAKSYLICQYRRTGMVFLPVDEACEVLMTRGALKKFSLLRSLDAAGVELEGIKLGQGEDHLVTHTPLVLARQMHSIDEEKLNDYAQYGVKSQNADVFHERAAKSIRRAQKALAEGDAAGYEPAATHAWRQEAKAYQGRFRLLYDVVSTTIFYFTLLIPFSYLMERLLFPQSTYLKSAVTAAIIFVVFVLLLMYFHPGFQLAGNIYVAIVSFLIIVFTLPAFFMIVGQGLRMLKAAGSKYFQRHTSEAERLGVLVAALSLSVANMRRRKLRTALTLGTITLLVLSLVLLTQTTSTESSYSTLEPETLAVVPYEGIVVTNTHYRNHALLRELVDLIGETYADNATILPRWYGYYGIRKNLIGFEAVRLYGKYPDEEFSVYDLMGGLPSPAQALTFPALLLRHPHLVEKAIRRDAFVNVPVIQYAQPEEARVTGIQRTLRDGRWFNDDDVHAAIISDVTAESLEAKVGETLELDGHKLELIGIFRTKEEDKEKEGNNSVYDPLGRTPTPVELLTFPVCVVGDPVLAVDALGRLRLPRRASVYDVLGHTPDPVEALMLPVCVVGDPALAADALNRLRLPKTKMDTIVDVTGHPILPIKLEENQSTPEEPTRYRGSRVIFLPLKFSQRHHWFPVAPYSVVLVPHDPGKIKDIAADISKRFDNVDVFSGIGGELTLNSAYRTATVSGSGLMVMPLVVSFLMIFSVMMGSVHERTREIYIFSSVGLSPKHVAGMFLVESIVYAGIASVWGYFLGIIMLHVFRVQHWLPPAFYPNYLGVFVIYSVGLAMLATVSSSLYPMYKAARIANPSLERTWRIDTDPEDGRWHITFPFISNKESETTGILAFMKEFVEHHAGEGMGVFAVQGPVTYECDRETRMHALRFQAWLAPFQRNVTQNVRFQALKDPTRPRWTFHFDLEHLSGVEYMWVKSNKAFVDAFRKQMLVWRGFVDEVLQEYARRGSRFISDMSGQEEGEGEAENG